MPRSPQRLPAGGFVALLEGLDSTDVEEHRVGGNCRKRLVIGDSALEGSVEAVEAESGLVAKLKSKVKRLEKYRDKRQKEDLATAASRKRARSSKDSNGNSFIPSDIVKTDTPVEKALLAFWDGTVGIRGNGSITSTAERQELMIRAFRTAWGGSLVKEIQIGSSIPHPA